MNSTNKPIFCRFPCISSVLLSESSELLLAIDLSWECEGIKQQNYKINYKYTASDDFVVHIVSYQVLEGNKCLFNLQKCPSSLHSFSLLYLCSLVSISSQSTKCVLDGWVGRSVISKQRVCSDSDDDVWCWLQKCPSSLHSFSLLYHLQRTFPPFLLAAS